MANDTTTGSGIDPKLTVQITFRVTEHEAQLLDERMRQLRQSLPDALCCARVRLGRQQGIRAALLTWLRLPIEEPV